MKRVLVFLGTLAFVWGALLISFSFSGLTGFAISSDNSGIYSVFGLSLIIGGLILVFTGATLERKVSSHSSAHETEVQVYDSSNGKGNLEQNYVMTDPNRHLSADGRITLATLKRDIAYLRKEKGGDEIIDSLKADYADGLREIASSNNRNSVVAKKFLEAMGENVDNGNNEYKMSTDDRREIQLAFRNYDGKPEKTHKEIFRKHGLVYDGKSGREPHSKIRFVDNRATYVIPDHLGDPRAGRNFANQLIKFIEEHNRKTNR